MNTLLGYVFHLVARSASMASISLAPLLTTCRLKGNCLRNGLLVKKSRQILQDMTLGYEIKVPSRFSKEKRD